MSKKKKTAEAVASFDGQKYINKKLSIQHFNTALIVGQFKSSSATADSTNPKIEHRRQSRCYYCLQWFEKLAGFGIWKRLGAAAIRYGLCRKCFDARLNSPPNLQRKFAEKCEKNLLNALEVKNG